MPKSFASEQRGDWSELSTRDSAWKQQLRISHELPSRRQPCAIREAVLRHIEDTVGSDPFTRP